MDRTEKPRVTLSQYAAAKAGTDSPPGWDEAVLARAEKGVKDRYQRLRAEYPDYLDKEIEHIANTQDGDEEFYR